MSHRFIIEGGRPLKGIIESRGSKNSATPIIAATLLTKEPCIIDNLPLIEDVFNMLHLIESLGAKITWINERKIKIEAKNIDFKKIDKNLVAKMRSSILVLGPLLARVGQAEINHPGGCVIGTRSIKTHLDAFTELGAKIDIIQIGSSFENKHIDPTRYSEKTNLYSLKLNPVKENKIIILDEFSVTGTENLMMACALISQKNIIKIAAAEPHVQELASFLRKMGVTIEGEGTSTITIKGKKKLNGAEHFISYDSVEAETYILMASAVGGKVEIKNTPIEYMDLFLKKLKDFGVNLEITKNKSVIVRTSKELKIDKIQALPYPGIPTDTQSVFGVLATQAKGLTLIHDPLYDGRLKYLEELNKMGADIIMCDPHRAVINGPSELYGTELGPLDLRSGAALIVAGLIAKGTTVIKNVSQVDRGYEKIEERLQKLGAEIKRIELISDNKK